LKAGARHRTTTIYRFSTSKN